MQINQSEHKTNLVNLGMAHVRSILITIFVWDVMLASVLKKLFIEPNGTDKGILCEEFLKCKPKMCRQQSCSRL